jgi:copper transport protein
VSSTPAPGASLLESPSKLELTFTERIDPATVVVRVLDAQQQLVPGLGAPGVDGAGVVATSALPELDPGTYTVSYQVVSAVDGHATAGLLAFVIDPTGAEAGPVQPASSTSPAVDPVTVGARWIALTGILVALGSLVMWANAGIGVLRGGSPEADRRPPWLLIGVSSALAMAGLAAYLTLAARPIVAAIGGGHGGHGGAGFPLDFAAPFGWTPFAIAMRVALAASAAAFVVGAARYFSLQDRVLSPGDDRRLAAFVAAVLVVGLGGMSMAGHAAATGGPAFGAIDWAHLASVAAWLGALPAAFVLARRAGATRRTTLGAILRRHSRVALVAGPVTALTGLANTPTVLGAPRDLVATGYGNLLIAKVVLLSVALGLGAVNHLALRRATRPRLPLLIGADLTVALLAVLVAATMVTIQPAAGRQDVLVTPPTSPAHLYGAAGPSNVHAAVSAAAPGRQTYRVTVTDAASGAPRDDVQKVFLTFTPPSTDLPAERVELEPDALPGSYSTVGAHTAIEGDWTLEVTVRRSGATDESVSFDLPVAAPEPPELVPPPDTGVDVPPPLGMLWDALPAGGAGWLPALLAAIGVAVAGWWARGGPRSRWLSAARVALLAVLAVTALGAGSRALVTAANQPAATPLENPVAADAESIARGERLYLANCASCHGVGGDGDGPVTTRPDAGPLGDAIGTYADGELSYRIAVGIAGTPMPAFAGTLSATDRWDLVNYLRQLTDVAGSQ